MKMSTDWTCLLESLKVVLSFPDKKYVSWNNLKCILSEKEALLIRSVPPRNTQAQWGAQTQADYDTADERTAYERQHSINIEMSGADEKALWLR